MKNKLYSSIVFNFLYEMLLIAIPLITTPYVSRVLGADGVGTYSYVMSLATYFTTFSLLGFAGYGQREIAYNRDNKEMISKLFFEIQSIISISVIIFTIGWIIFSICYTQNTVYMLALTPNILAVMFSINWFYRGMEKFRFIVTFNTIVKVLSTLSIFLFVRKSSDIFIYILIIALSNLIGTIPMWFLLPKFIKKSKIDFHSYPKHFKQALIYFLPSIALVVYSVLDKTLIGLITNKAAENGYYEQAHKIVNLILTICCTSANTVFNSRMAYLYGKGTDQKEIESKNRKIIDFSLTFSIAAMFGLYAVGRKFVPLFFGKSFSRTLLLLYIFAPMPFFATFSNCLSANYYTPGGRRLESAICYCIASGINLLFNLILIPFYGAAGAAISTLISELFVAIVLISRSKGVLTLNVALNMVFKKLIAGLAMAAIVFAIDSVTSFGWRELIIEVLFGGVVYFTVLNLLNENTVISFATERLKTIFVR